MCRHPHSTVTAHGQDSCDSPTAFQSQNHVPDRERFDGLAGAVRHHDHRTAPDALQIMGATLIFLFVFFVLAPGKLNRPTIDGCEQTPVPTPAPVIAGTKQLADTGRDLLKLSRLAPKEQCSTMGG